MAIFVYIYYQSFVPQDYSIDMILDQVFADSTINSSVLSCCLFILVVTVLLLFFLYFHYFFFETAFGLFFLEPRDSRKQPLYLLR